MRRSACNYSQSIAIMWDSLVDSWIQFNHRLFASLSSKSNELYPHSKKSYLKIIKLSLGNFSWKICIQWILSVERKAQTTAPRRNTGIYRHVLKYTMEPVNEEWNFAEIETKILDGQKRIERDKWNLHCVYK